MADAQHANGASDGALDAMLVQVRRCLQREVDAIGNDRAGVLPAALLVHAAELGLYGLGIPERHGGLGLDLGDTCRLVSEVAYFDRSLATSIGLHNGLGIWGLVHRGDEAQQRRWLPRLATGSVAAFAATEAGAGSDLAAVTTSVEEVPGGLRLDGEKQYVTNGGFADVFTVLARARGKKRRYQLLCVPRTLSGVSVGPEERKLGIRASSTTPVVFRDVVLPHDAVLGESSAGLHDAYGALSLGRAVMSAGCIGTARRAFDDTLRHVTTRRQFRRPISAFGATRSHVATMATRLFAMEALLDHVGAEHRRGANMGSLTTAAKIFCSEGAFDITDRALQLHGAMGFLEDTGIALLARDCRVTRIFEGANDVLLALLGSELLSAPDSASSRRTHTSSAAFSEPWERAHEALQLTCASIRSGFGVRVIDRQDVLHAVARAHIALLVASVVMARRDAAPHLSDRATRASLSAAEVTWDDIEHESTTSLTEELYAAGHWKGLEA